MPVLGGEELTGHVGAQTPLASRRDAPAVARGDPAGYFQPEWAHVVVEDLERSPKQPPAGSSSHTPTPPVWMLMVTPPEVD